MSGSQYDYVETTGVIVPDTATTLDVVESEWQGVFGADLSVDAETPQGVMITAETIAREAVIVNNAEVANQINPNQAGGVFLDALAALTGLQRSASTFTTVTGVVLAGVASSPVASGSIVETPAGDQFALQADVTLDATTGQAIGVYVAVVAGVIPAPTGAFTIITNVLGLETVTNPGTGVSIGSVQQDDETFRVLRRNTLALQGVAVIEAITSNVAALNGVLSKPKFLENLTASTVTNSGITLVAHSIWLCVDGGSDIDVATALLNNKTFGADWNGGTTVTVHEPISDQDYDVKFDRPTLVPLVVKVTCKQATYTGNPTVDVPTAVVSFANNEIPSLQGWTVGQAISTFEIASAVTLLRQGLYVSKVEISLKSSVSYSTNEIVVAINEKATILVTDVAVVLS